MLSGEALDLAFALRAQVGPLLQGDGPAASTLREATGLPQPEFERALAELESVGFIAIDRRSATTSPSSCSPRCKSISTTWKARAATISERTCDVLRRLARETVLFGALSAFLRFSMPNEQAVRACKSGGSGL